MFPIYQQYQELRRKQLKHRVQALLPTLPTYGKGAKGRAFLVKWVIIRASTHRLYAREVLWDGRKQANW
jgi:hypothetical protein